MNSGRPSTPGRRRPATSWASEIIWKGPLKEDDRNEQIQIVETMIAAGVDAIVLTPMDDRALVAPVAEAKQAGIPTVIFNSALSGDDYVAYISTDNRKGGRLAGEYIGSLMKGRGKLILIRVIEGVEGGRQREDGFLEAVKAGFPGIKILSDNQYAGITTETAYQTTDSLLSRFPDVEAIFTPNESTTFGCLRALKDRGLAGRVIHVGFDSSKKLIEALEKKEIQRARPPGPVPHGLRQRQDGGGASQGRALRKIVDTGVFLATPENMNEPEIRKLLVPDLSILNR